MTIAREANEMNTTKTHPKTATPIKSAWLAHTEEGTKTTPTASANYALARVVHYVTENDTTVTVDDTIQIALRKLVRTFTPISNKVKLDNGQSEFGTLEAALLTVASARCNYLDLSDEDEAGTMTLARDCHRELRSLLGDEQGRNTLRSFARPTPARPEKKPYVRS